MLNDYRDIYSVSRGEYKDFVRQIKPEYRNVEVIDLNEYTQATKIFSKKTGKCLCARVSYRSRIENEEPHPEQYYIFELPDNEERLEPIPRVKVELTSAEQVQKLLDGLAKMKKEQRNND